MGRVADDPRGPRPFYTATRLSPRSAFAGRLSPRRILSDYSGSGYDRGHLVPSADRFANPQLNEETFMMTNIVPKTAALNQGPWEKLERHARALARRLGAVQQIAGCYGEKERLKGKVAVPTNCWKIIVALPSGRTVADRDRRMQVIAVDMPNIDGIDDVRWETYRTTIRAIEQRTGLDILNNFPSDVQEIFEARVDMKNP
ncbi:MAG TPA: hypothetical protein DEP46_15425 [Blastocatellia bacterium]|nr:hypothetical protein [Blastocatellia bacterium]